MTPAEVGYRVLKAAQARLERAGALGVKAVPRADFSRLSTSWVHVPKVNPARYLAAADRIADGWLDVFAMKGIDFGAPPRWNRDPKTGIEAPLVFGKLLDYRDPDVVGDIKYLWEPNRHLHLVTLAQAYALSGRSRYLDVIAEHLESWFLAAPYPLGANWSSSLEAAMRLINWSATWHLIGGLKSPLFNGKEFLKTRWLSSVYQHAEFIRGWLSLYSSANNHLIGEAAGLFMAGVTWPHWPRARRWLNTGRRILEREILLQNAPDGVNREQAVQYQQFEIDLLLACLLAGKANRERFSPAFEARLEAMVDFIASIMDCGGHVPMFGDSDDGYALRLSQEEKFCPFRSVLATGAVLYKRGDFKQKARALDDKTRWLLGDSADAQFDALDERKAGLPPRQQFPDGGYYILGANLEREDEIRLVADAGPLGYRSIAAHGHADALSFTLSVGGREFLVDPGTYAYHTHGRWRKYFRGTAAHNTVRVDGVDQSEPGGNFMWMTHARAGCSLWLSSAEKDTFEGWHTGYLRLLDPVRHRRLIALEKKARRIIVEDTLQMEDEHEVELFFHCSERCRADAVPGGYVLAREGVTVKIVLPENGEMSLYNGSVAPISGWVSRAFDEREPAPTLVWRALLKGSTTLRTELTISP